MDRFVVRGISADDAAENLIRQVHQHDEMLHRRALDREYAAVAKRGLGRPRKLFSIGLGLARDPAASPSTPPPPSRTGRSHENWWHPANSSSANTSSAGNSSGDDGSNDDGSASSEGWVGSKLAAGVAGRTRSASEADGQTGAAARVAGRTKSATGVFALAKAAAWVTARARKFECSGEDAEICRHCKQPQEHHDFMGEVQCPI
ncbi:hypothetical protein QJQ45_010937 [Haematococcus lacustris]|nr:hypothetical protein QJQ45_010937 [Haematococcus lacustris]